MVDLGNIISPELLSIYPQYKSEDGKAYKLESFEIANGEISPLYAETEEIPYTEAVEILLGGAS